MLLLPKILRGAACAVCVAYLGAGPAAAADGGTAPAASDTNSTAKATVGGDNDLSLEQLINVEITTASKSEEKESDAPGIVSVVTKDELRRFGGTTLKDILERVPGLIGSSVFMTDRSTISVRGDQISDSGEHVLLLINGRPVREDLEGGIKSEILETFPVDIIERIEVIKGPGSVLYGSSAFSGVINVITVQPEKTGVSATALGGEAGAHEVKADVNYKSGDFSLLAAGQYLQKANWPVDYVSATGGGNIVNHIDIPNRGTGAYLGANYKDFSLMAAYNEWATAYFIPDFVPFLSSSGAGIAHWQKTFANLGYDTQVNDFWRTTANVTFTRSQFDTTLFPFVKRDSYEGVLEWANFLTLTEKAKLTLGGLATRIAGTEEDSSTGNITSDGHRLDFGLYAQMDYQLLKTLDLIAGAQANKVEGVKWDAVPRGGLIWHPTPRISVKALYGQAFRAPSINETRLNNIALQGNPNLKSEHVGTIDLGISYQGEQMELGAGLFRSELSDTIFQDRSGAPRYANQVGSIILQGAEIEGKYYVTRELFLTGSALYQTSRDANDINNIAPIANYGLKAGISYACTNGFTVGLFNIYQGPLDSKYNSQLNPSPGAYNKLSLHLSLNLKTFLHYSRGPEASAILQADNLLDQQIWLPDWGLAPGQSMPYEKGRSIFAGFRLAF